MLLKKNNVLGNDHLDKKFIQKNYNDIVFTNSRDVDIQLQTTF